MLRKTLLPSFDSIPASTTTGTALLTLPRGKRYHRIVLEFADNGAASTGNAANVPATLAKLGNDVRVKLGGHPQRTASLVQLDQVNKRHGANFAAHGIGTAGNANYRTRVPIYFAEPWRKALLEADAPAINVDGGFGDLQIELDLTPAVALVNPAISGWYEWEPLTGPLKSMVRWERQGLTASGTSNDFPLSFREGILQALHLFQTSDAKTVIKALLTGNNEVLNDLLDVSQQASLLTFSDMVGDNSNIPRMDIELDWEDPVLSGLLLNGLNSLVLQAQYGTVAAGVTTSGSAAGSLPMIAEILGRPI